MGVGMAVGAQAGSATWRATAAHGRPAAPIPSPSPPNAAPRHPYAIREEPDEACPELACVRHLLPADILAAAQQRAAAVGVGADRVLIAGGAIGEEDYLRALCERLGIVFEPLDRLPRRLCPLDDQRLIEAAGAGLLPISDPASDKDDLTLVVAPRGIAARRILRLVEADASLARRFRFTSAERFNRFVLRYGGAAFAARAGGWLQQQWPTLSAAPPRCGTRTALMAAVLALLTGARWC